MRPASKCSFETAHPPSSGSSRSGRPGAPTPTRAFTHSCSTTSIATVSSTSSCCEARASSGIAERNGHPDLLSSRAHGDLVLYSGDERGRFSGEPQAIAFDEPLRGPSVLTTGDVDADGDLDVWVGQYKPAYAGGQMPSPFYDANDGYPSYLLLNDGDGNWTPATPDSARSASGAPTRAASWISTRTGISICSS
jgi:hypothetical protein